MGMYKVMLLFIDSANKALFCDTAYDLWGKNRSGRKSEFYITGPL